MIFVLLKLCLRSTPDLLSSDKSDEDDQGGLNARFKTEICRNFKEKGHCLYGDLCQFAHGKEVKNILKHSSVKTELFSRRCEMWDNIANIRLKDARNIG